MESGTLSTPAATEPRIYDDVSQLIGNTPLIRLSRFAKGVDAEILGKLEAANPGSSVKDRIGLAMIEAAEREGLLKPGGIIVEPTSGNTGIGLAVAAAVKGYRLILTMPSSMSVERRKLLIAFGAEIVLTDAEFGMPGAIEEAEILVEELGAFMPQQFMNPANPDVHYRTTGPEIWRDCDGKIDVFVAGVGTGGTISGVGRYLKEQDPNIHVVAVEPIESPVLSGGQMGPHMIQGIGAGFIPDNYDGSVVDEVITIESQESIEAAKEVAKTEGLCVGISAGGNALAARKLAERPEFAGKRIVTILCDTGERYVSTLLFYED
jgi:cysteine synthase A